MPREYWLVKTEPDVYSIEQFRKDKVTFWDGVRNYEARNILRDRMKKGDRAFVYHSNATPSAIVGTAEVVKGGVPDPSAFDKKHPYHDPDSDPKAPTWYGVELRLLTVLRRAVTLDDVKQNPALRHMALLKRSRLSVQPVTRSEWDAVLAMAT